MYAQEDERERQEIERKKEIIGRAGNLQPMPDPYEEANLKTVATEMPCISGAELLDLGYCQEANRLFFHPLGLAMGVDRESGEVVIYDSRDDEEGVYFAPGKSSASEEKASLIYLFWKARSHGRLKHLGYVVQPPENL